MNSPRVAVLGVYHETNTFSPIQTRLDDFNARWYVGAELLGAFEGTRTVIGGFLDGASARGLEAVPVFGAFATPSGPVTVDAFETILASVHAGISAAGAVDGVFLELHGDFAVTGRADPEQEILDLIRSLLPGVPVAIVLDLHANMARARLTEAEILIGYLTNPHVDTATRGHRAAELLAEVIRGDLRPYRAHAGVDIVAIPSAQRTDAEPLRSLLALANEAQVELGLDDVTVHGGYAYGDSIATGMGFSATSLSGDPVATAAAVDRLRAHALIHAPEFSIALASPEEACERAVAAAGTVAIADVGDNINGGTPGDTTWLLHLLARRSPARVLATVADRTTLEAARTAGVTGTFLASVGGHASPRSGEPLLGTATVLALSDGVFHNEGPMARGALVDMDGAAVINIGNADILVQGRPVQPNDSNMFRSLGIDPADYKVILLKGASAIRADWSSRVAEIIDAATVGETDSMLSRLKYRFAPAFQ